jgi:predicted TIM-barrel fold metal-dependent hydrolase
VDDEDPGLPIGLTPASNGEFRPLPATPLVREVVRRSHLALDANARRAGMSRRDFLLSAAGSATMLAVLASCAKESGDGNGGTFSVPPDSTVAPDVAEDALGGDEFIFDVQGHFLDYPPGTTQPLPSFPQSDCGDGYDCYSVETFLDLLFAQSDTSVVVLSAVPFPGDLLPSQVMAEAIGLADRLCGEGHVLMQGHATPSAVGADALPDTMAEVADRFRIRAWKAYTHAGGPGWYLDDPLGDVFLEQAVALDLPTIAVHKGFGRQSEHSSPRDVGPAAAAHPDVNLVIYHSGFDGFTEGAYDPDGPGVDRLIRSLEDAEVGPGQNVYAELGSTWRTVMGSPDQAAHVLGKLLVAVGPDNVCWGTDSIWYGSPQDQIEAFRAFEITPEYQERFGYPALTPELKAKILGGSSARLYGIDPTVDACRLDRADRAAARSAAGVRNLIPGPTTAAQADAVWAGGEPWTWA